VRLLLDTHAFLWWVNGGEQLTPRARRAVADPANECFVSLASAWEMAIKTSLGKLHLPASPERFVSDQLAANQFRLLAIDLRHASGVASLPFHHRDPFDRLLVAQALAERLAIVSADSVFRRYGVKRVW
jgi:PIN domain nuclease of toxin-antitoxin system